MGQNLLAKTGVAYFDDDGKPICGAQRANMPGVRCQQRPLKGALRCKKHGGKSLKGAVAPAYKDGRFLNRYNGAHRLQARMESALSDPEYLSLRPELAMVDAMLAERWETLEDSVSDDLWEKLDQQFLQFKMAVASGDVRKMRSVLTQLDDTVSKGNDEAKARQEIRELIKDRQRLAESMQKTLIALKQTVTVEQTIMMLQEVIQIVSGTVSDRKEVSEVMRKIVAVTQRKGEELPVPKREVVTT